MTRAQKGFFKTLRKAIRRLTKLCLKILRFSGLIFFAYIFIKIKLILELLKYIFVKLRRKFQRRLPPPNRLLR